MVSVHEEFPALGPTLIPFRGYVFVLALFRF